MTTDAFTPSRPAVPPEREASPSGSPREVFGAFAKLGVTAFGGPIAHLGYFREEFVLRRRWLSDASYADLVALCQFLPGPASSQVGFALGLMRAGWLGALAAWTAFTLPSAIALVLFAYGAANLDEGPGAALIHGLKIVAVAVVAQAVLGMARTLTPDRVRATIALAAVAVIAAVPDAFGQIAAIVLGALASLIFCRGAETRGEPAPLNAPVTRRTALLSLVTFAVLLAALPLLARLGDTAAFLAGIYRSGALVFGGGHVVLPLLEAETVAPGLLSADIFLAGYGAAQALPGPLFTFAAYLGAAYDGPPVILAALILIFLPGMLLLIAALPWWTTLSRRPLARAALAGTNSAVVGILGAALYDPVFTSAVRDPGDFALALAGFVLLVAWKCPPWFVVAVSALGGLVAMG